MKTFKEIKNKPHDLSGINDGEQELFVYEKDNGSKVYYPKLKIASSALVLVLFGKEAIDKYLSGASIENTPFALEAFIRHETSIEDILGAHTGWDDYLLIKEADFVNIRKKYGENKELIS